MKDFAKSIVCNTKAGNAEIVKDGGKWVVMYAEGTKSKEFDNEAEAKRFAAQVGNKKVGNAKDKNGKELRIGDIVAVKTSDPSLNHGKIVRISGDQVSVDVTGDDDIWTTPARLTVKMGNQKVGNGITKFGLGRYVIADGHKAIVLGEKEERGPNGIPFGWVTIRWVEGPWKGQSDQYYDYDLKKA